MKFTYFGYDFMLPTIRRLIEDGHELVGIFSFECDNVFNFNTETLALGQELNIPIILSKPTDTDIQNMLAEGTEVFLAAGYRYKIPVIDDKKAYGINLHPSYLPKGRGIMPTPSIIINHPEASGMTIHKITSEYDAGDILFQEQLPISETETVETYSTRIAMRAPDILSRVMADLPHYWNAAKQQDETQATTFPMPTNAMRMLDWNAPVDAIKKTSRAFGYFGSLCMINGQLLVVYDIDVWEENHDFTPGTIAHQEARLVIMTAKNGFVCLKNFQIVEDPEAQTA